MKTALHKIISAPTLEIIEGMAEASGRSVIEYLNDFLAAKHMDTPNLWVESLLLPWYSTRTKAQHAAEVFSEQYGKFCRNLTFKALVHSVSKRRWKRLVLYTCRRPLICTPGALVFDRKR